MAHLNSIPDSKTVQGSYSNDTGQSTGLPITKLVPKNLDGTVFDCTGYNTATFNFTLPQINDPGSTTQAMTVGTADATGIEVSMTNAQLTTLIGKMASASIRGAVVIGNGTDDLIAASLQVAAVILG